MTHCIYKGSIKIHQYERITNRQAAMIKNAFNGMDMKYGESMN